MSPHAKQCFGFGDPAVPNPQQIDLANSLFISVESKN